MAGSLPLPPDSTSGRICHEGNPGDMLKRVNPYLLLGYRAIDGNAGIYAQRHLGYHNLKALRVGGAGWYWQPPNDVQRVAGLTPPPGGGWCRVPRPLPRARLVSAVRVSDMPRDDLKTIDIDTTALVARPSHSRSPIQVPPRSWTTVRQDHCGRRDVGEAAAGPCRKLPCQLERSR